MTEFKGKRVLVTDGDSRQILPILKGLHELGCIISTLNKSKLDNGYTSKYVSNRILLKTDKPDELVITIRELLTSKSFDVLTILSDANMDLLTRHFDEFSNFVRIPFPNREVFLRAYDKQKTMEYCMNDRIPCPLTKLESEPLDEFIEKIGFPLVAKPRMACGSMGLKIIRSKEQLDTLISSGEIAIEKYVIQEYIPQTGKQINVHLFMDDNQQLCSGVVTEKSRWYPVDGGASCLCRTIKDEKVLSDCERLLKAIQWRSYCEIELIVDPRDNVAKVMEINGRASASIKIMDLAGVNVAKQMMQLAYGEPVEKMMDYKQDVRLRRLSTDCLWFIQSKDRFKRKPNWFSLVRTHEATFSMKDPMPFLGTAVNLLNEIPNYKKEMSKRRRT